MPLYAPSSAVSLDRAHDSPDLTTGEGDSELAVHPVRQVFKLETDKVVSRGGRVRRFGCRSWRWRRPISDTRRDRSGGRPCAPRLGRTGIPPGGPLLDCATRPPRDTTLAYSISERSRRALFGGYERRKRGLSQGRVLHVGSPKRSSAGPSNGYRFLIYSVPAKAIGAWVGNGRATR